MNMFFHEQQRRDSQTFWDMDRGGGGLGRRVHLRVPAGRLTAGQEGV